MQELLVEIIVNCTQYRTSALTDGWLSATVTLTHCWHVMSQLPLLPVDGFIQSMLTAADSTTCTELSCCYSVTLNNA